MRVAIATVAVLMIGPADGAEVTDWLSVRPFFGQPSTSTDPVKLIIHGYRLEIPRNYLVTALRTNYVNERNYLGLTMMAAPPNLGGAMPETLHGFRSIGWDHPELIVINSWDYLAGYAEEFYPQLIGQARSRAGAMDGDLIGVPNPGPGRYLVSLGHPGERDILVSCLDYQSGRITRCQIIVQIRPGVKARYPGLGFRYEFDISKIDQIRVMDTKVRSLLDNFVKGVAE